MTNQKRSILITRPEPAASDLAATLRREGFTVFIAPMLQYAPRECDLSGIAACQALAFSSMQGVEAFAAQSAVRHMPVFAVGEATAKTAQKHGFASIYNADGDMTALATLIGAQKETLGIQRVLYVSAADPAQDLPALLTAPGITVDTAVAYKAEQAESLPPDIERALKSGKISTVTFFSARTAENFCRILQSRGLADITRLLEAVCLSPRVTEAAKAMPFRTLRTAPEPKMEAMIDALRSVEKPFLPGSLPAASVIAAFGGIDKAATSLSLPVSMVQSWSKRGFIPAAQVQAVFVAARKSGIDLGAEVRKGKKSMTDTTKAPEPADPARERRRGEERRKTPPAFDANGNIVTPTYVGPDRRSGLDRRDFQDHAQPAKEDKIIREKWKFINRTAITSAFITAAVLYAGAFLMAPEIFSAHENAEKLKAVEAQMAALQQRAAAVARTHPVGGTLNSAIEQVSNAAENIQLTDVSQLSHVVSSFGQMMQAPDGQGAMAAMMEKIKTITAENAGNPAAIDQALSDARAADPAMGVVFKNIPSANLRAAAMLLALNEFRNNVGTGRSFDEDLSMMEKMSGADAETKAAIANLAPFAKAGVLSRSGLQSEFKNIAGEIVMAKLKGEDASVKARVMQHFADLVQVRRTDDITGDSVDAIVARAQLYLDKGDVRAASNELKKLQGAPASAAAPFVQKADETATAEDFAGQLTMAILGAMSANTGFSVDGLKQGLGLQGNNVIYLSPSMQ